MRNIEINENKLKRGIIIGLHTRIGCLKMEEYQIRVSDEKISLDIKIRDLAQFMSTHAFSDLSASNQGLLMVQIESMKLYSATLGRRIELFNE